MSRNSSAWMYLVLSLTYGCSAPTGATTTAAATDSGQESSAPAALTIQVRDTRRDVSAIEMVLWQDQMAAQQGQMFQNAGRGGAAAANWMVGRMKAIDTSSCPTEFRTAYLKHCQAWQDMVEQLRTERREMAERLLTFALKAAVMKNADFSLLHGSEGRKRCVEAIRNTWKDVELIAVQAGAKLRQ